MSKVYLIGGGPGDQELITVKAIRALQKCTAIVYDRLASFELLKYVKEDCEIYYCGKEPGCHYKTQEEINDMLVYLAKKGHIVGRIKGGDPYIFGRGGEEALTLLKENIEFEVIPGVTSPIAVLNYAGIPTTHRKIAQSFHVFTGRAADELNIDWNVISKLKGTLIFLMGFKSLKDISENLIKYGMDKNTKVAVVMRGTTSKQKKVVANLNDIYNKALEKQITSPAIIVVGDVVNFNEKLNWYEKKILFGKNICITRSKAQSKGLREALLDLGAEVTEINSIKIKNTEDNIHPYLSKIKDYKYIVFTSVNGVNIFFDYLKKNKYDVRNIKADIAVIGPATYDAVVDRGLIPSICAKHFVAESLLESLKKVIKKEDEILVPRSKQARPFLVDELRRENCSVDEVYTYEVICGEYKDVNNFNKVDTIVFTSPSTVKNMISIVGLENIKNKDIISIGPITGDELKKHSIDFKMCDKYSIDGVIEKLKEIY